MSCLRQRKNRWIVDGYIDDQRTRRRFKTSKQAQDYLLTMKRLRQEELYRKSLGLWYSGMLRERPRCRWKHGGILRCRHNATITHKRTGQGVCKLHYLQP
jgi:hypothetical protein